MNEIMMNGRWPVKVLMHRANLPHWAFWEAVRLSAMYAAIRPGDVLLDIGAEEGDMSALYGLWGAQMMLIEPAKHFWPNIRQTFEGNDLAAPLKSYVGLAGMKNNQMGKVETGWPEASEGEVHTEGGFMSLIEGGETTPQITVDDFVADDHVDVISMDTEGSELEIIFGATKVLTEQKPIVFISVHPEFMRHYKRTKDDLLVHMGKLGYAASHLGTDHEEHWMFK